MNTKFETKNIRFSTGVTVNISEYSVDVHADNGNSSISSANLDNFTYVEYSEARITPFALISRTIGLGLLLLFFKPGTDIEAISFTGNILNITMFYFGLILLLIGVVAFFLYVIDLLTALNLFNRLVSNFFANKGYIVNIGNKSGNNIEFITDEDEFSKVMSLKKALDTLKEFTINKKSSKTIIANEVNSEKKTSNIDDLLKISEMYQKGFLTEVEFNRMKLEIINKN